MSTRSRPMPRLRLKLSELMILIAAIAVVCLLLERVERRKRETIRRAAAVFIRVNPDSGGRELEGKQGRLTRRSADGKYDEVEFKDPHASNPTSRIRVRVPVDPS
jgi:hypothetical protein